MRISILLQREPFGKIIEETLSKFLSVFFGNPYIVEWHENTSPQSTAKQFWLCNIYLNAIFVPKVKTSVLLPLRLELGYSRVWYRRPFQYIYSELAGRRVTSRVLAQRSLCVTPPVDHSDERVFVGGNHKVRLLDNFQGMVHSVLKAGFDPQYLQREVEARGMAYQLGLPVPRLTYVDTENFWFSEQMTVGTPANRLKDRLLRRRSYTCAAKSLEPFLRETTQVVRLGNYTQTLVQRISHFGHANTLLSSEDREVIFRVTYALMDRLKELSALDLEWALARTHGDFQPANMLVDQEKVWLIDWEYSAQRQSTYDWLVFGLNSRFPHGLADRLQTFVKKGTLSVISGEFWKDERSRHVSSLVFCLEEMLLYLEENSNPRFFRLSGALLIFSHEIDQWLGLGKL